MTQTNTINRSQIVTEFTYETPLGTEVTMVPADYLVFMNNIKTTLKNTLEITDEEAEERVIKIIQSCFINFFGEFLKTNYKVKDSEEGEPHTVDYKSLVMFLTDNLNIYNAYMPDEESKIIDVLQTPTDDGDNPSTHFSSITSSLELDKIRAFFTEFKTYLFTILNTPAITDNGISEIYDGIVEYLTKLYVPQQWIVQSLMLGVNFATMAPIYNPFFYAPSTTTTIPTYSLAYCAKNSGDALEGQINASHGKKQRKGNRKNDDVTIDPDNYELWLCDENGEKYGKIPMLKHIYEEENFNRSFEYPNFIYNGEKGTLTVKIFNEVEMNGQMTYSIDPTIEGEFNGQHITIGEFPSTKNEYEQWLDIQNMKQKQVIEYAKEVIKYALVSVAQNEQGKTYFQVNTLLLDSLILIREAMRMINNFNQNVEATLAQNFSGICGLYNKTEADLAVETIPVNPEQYDSDTKKKVETVQNITGNRFLGCIELEGNYRLITPYGTVFLTGLDQSDNENRFLDRIAEIESNNYTGGWIIREVDPGLVDPGDPTSKPIIYKEVLFGSNYAGESQIADIMGAFEYILINANQENVEVNGETVYPTLATEGFSIDLSTETSGARLAKWAPFEWDTPSPNENYVINAVNGEQYSYWWFVEYTKNLKAPGGQEEIQYLKITSVDYLYNELMEKRTFDTEEIVIENVDYRLNVNTQGATEDITKQVGWYEYKQDENAPALIKKQDYSQPEEGAVAEDIQEPEVDVGWTRVTILAIVQKIAEEDVPGKVKLVACIPGKANDCDFTVQTEEETLYYKDIHYGMVGSEYNAEIDVLMERVNQINIAVDPNIIIPRPEGIFEITIVEDGEQTIKETRKLTRKEILMYIQQAEKVLSAMPLNRRYINELLGYFAKIVGFEALRLPCVIQTGDDKGKGLESADSGVVEPFTESFVQDGVVYSPSTEMDIISYKFVDGINRHTEMIAKIENLFRAMTTLSNELDTITGSTVTISSEQLLYDNMVELLAAWEEYYKGRVVADASQLTTENTQLEMYEEENVYKIFISVMQQDGTEDTTVVKSLVSTDGADADVDSSALEQFITGVLDWLKPEIKEIFNVKEDIKNMSITDFVSYNDPIKQKSYSYQMANPESNADQKNKNDLIEYSQMLSLIQEERNKIQRKGLKDKLIVKFVQTEKGTYFELLGTEMIDSDSTSKVFGYFLSENSEGNTSGEGMEPDHHIPTKPKGTKRKSRKEARIVEKEQEPSFEKIPEKRNEQYHLRLTKVPVFYAGEPLDWRNDNYYSNKVYLHNLDNLYVGIDPEYAARVNTVQTTKEETLEDNSKKITILEKDMIGYYLVNIEYDQQ